MKNKKILFGTFIALLLLLTTGLSYAYFSTSVSGNNDAKDVIVETGTLKLVYTDSPEIVAEHIKPGWSTTKVVTVKNTGTLDVSYNLVWQELTNEITNNELVISASCERLNSSNAVEGTCESITESSVGNNKIKKNISIESGITHKYTFTITLKEMNQGQDYNQNKKFNGVIGVEEYKKITPTPIYCTFDGELTQGAEYVNGEYTYRYMQKTVYEWDIESHTNVISWNNMSEDGWGVRKTDNSAPSNEIVSAPCTYINDKAVVSYSNMFNIYTNQAKKLDLSNFNTSNVTDMSYMFYESQATTLDLSSFDTSNVTDMSNMFLGSWATTLDLSSFDTSNVTDMSYMFASSQATTLDLSNFNTSKVTDMSNMFLGSGATTLDLSNFNTSKVTSMGGMFQSSKIVNLDLSSFDTSNVTDMGNMFKNSQVTVVKGLNNFNTSKVTDMAQMFAGCMANALDLSSFNTSKVTDMGSMFAESQATILDLSNFNTSNVTYMSEMFSGSKATSIDLSNFNTSKVTSMNSMFQDSKIVNLDLSSFDTSNVTDMNWMFKDSQASVIKGLNNFNTSKVTSMGGMFENSKIEILDLSNFDTSKVTDSHNMFKGNINLKTIYASSKFNTSAITSNFNSRDMFTGCTNLVGGNGTTYDSTKVDKTYARIDTASTRGYFTAK